MLSNGTINHVMLEGNLGADPDLKTMPNGTAVCKMRLATSRAFKDKDGNRQERTEWHSVTAFGQPAQTIAQHMKKGGKLAVQGYLRTDSWEVDGVTKYSTYVVVEQFTMQGKGNGNGNGNTAAAAAPTVPEDDIPF